MAEVPSSYPPPRHLLRDLRIVVERDAGGATASLEIVPEMLDGTGRPRVGVLATLVDVVAGETAIRAVAPSWIATSDLSVSVAALPPSGSIEVRPRVIRRGRQTVVLEAIFRERHSRAEIGLATLGFAVLPARGEIQTSPRWSEAPEPRSELALPDSGLRKTLLDAIGLELDPTRPGVARLAVRPDLLNSLGAVQGGAIAILAEAAADHLATLGLGLPVRVRSLALHYLKLARVGPVRAEARAIARTLGGVLVRVELFDEGGGDELLTVATVQVDAGDSDGADTP